MVTFLRKYGFAIYWMTFAVYTLEQAHFPGMITNYEEWRYPWGAVFKIWVLLAVLIGLFYVIIRPSSYDYSWGRLTGAFVFSATLSIIGAVFYVTDQPGYFYVPVMFSMVSLAFILLFFFTQVVVYTSGRRMG